MELIDRLLANMEVGVAGFSLCDVRVGAQLTFSDSPTASLHYCLEGKGEIRLRNGPTFTMRQHSFALVPSGVVYTLGANDQEEHSLPHRLLRVPSFYESVPTIKAGDGPVGVVTVCGEIAVQDKAVPDLFAYLSGPLIEQFDAGDELQDRFIVLLAESARPAVGTRALTEALLKQCLILLLRRRIDRGEPAIPWITALTDPGLARGLKAMLERPSERFTVETLARLAGMSRSAFAARFTRAFKRTPLNLLKSERLRRGRELLITTDMSVAQVASSVGFSSRSNFSHSFRAAYGTDPSSLRAAAFRASDEDE